LDSLENILEGGRTGPAVVPDKPDKGLIMMMSISKGGKPAQMPPGDKDLSQKDIDLIREWIRQGLK
jgi:hypothetical protein